MKKIPTPMTEEQMREKLRGATIVTPQYGQGISIDKKEDDKSKEVKDFSHISISSTGFSFDEVGVDGNGKEHIFPGGLWVTFNWALPGFGFGELRITKQLDGKTIIDSENLGKDFVKAMLCELVEKSEVK